MQFTNAELKMIIAVLEKEIPQDDIFYDIATDVFGFCGKDYKRLLEKARRLHETS